MIKILTLDCETMVGYPKGDPRWEHPERMPLAVLGMDVHFGSNHDLCWWGPNVEMLNMCADNRSANDPMMQKYLDAADLVLTFNGEHFDFAVMEGAGFDMTHARAVSFDLMARFVDETGHRISLADFARALGVSDTKGSGENAVQLWQSANMLMSLANATKDEVIDFDPTENNKAYTAGAKHLYQSVIDYCLHDVRITRKCYDALIRASGRMQYWQRFKKGYRQIQMALPPHDEDYFGYEREEF